MQYICEKCNFVFHRTGEVEQCPNCDNRSIKETEEQEEKKE